ncbi:hypothetical protein [Paraburkholderia sacchari]|uniref:hypothetical protein n=1 Tax=Paraburkholderia sacchari TaxID=159450 RepID=UPI001BCEBEC3|nr:hypothetical protein [Paraburkholderia sacchari]
MPVIDPARARPEKIAQRVREAEEKRRAQDSLHAPECGTNQLVRSGVAHTGLSFACLLSSVTIGGCES